MTTKTEVTIKFSDRDRPQGSFALDAGDGDYHRIDGDMFVIKQKNHGADGYTHYLFPLTGIHMIRIEEGN